MGFCPSTETGGLFPARNESRWRPPAGTLKLPGALRVPSPSSDSKLVASSDCDLLALKGWILALKGWTDGTEALPGRLLDPSETGLLERRLGSVMLLRGLSVLCTCGENTWVSRFGDGGRTLPW